MYDISIHGYVPSIPSNDADDAREEALELVKRLQERGHRITSVRVNGQPVEFQEEEEADIDLP